MRRWTGPADEPFRDRPLTRGERWAVACVVLALTVGVACANWWVGA